jgi:hypothetical protein
MQKFLLQYTFIKTSIVITFFLFCDNFYTPRNNITFIIRSLHKADYIKISLIGLLIVKPVCRSVCFIFEVGEQI